MRSGWIASALVAVTCAIGCAKVIGLEKREGPEPDDMGGNPNDDGSGGKPSGPIDKPTGKVTTEDCIDYCDAIQKNCPDGTENQQYIERETCINTCNALEPGEKAEPTGNTVACRLRQAKAASNNPGEFCPFAGALGGGECGTNCDAWCTLLEAACPDDFEVLANCNEACSGLKDSGNRNFQNSYPSAPDLQCRVYHLGAAFDNPTVHCTHARYVPESTCVADVPEPTCDEYCSKVMANCRAAEGDEPNRKVYETEAECMAACDAFPIGKSKDLVENTLGCRIYHAGASATSPNIHCAHASPAGDGHCGIDGDAGTGNCTSYCLLYRDGCKDAFDAEHAGLVECVRTCSDDFASRGAPKDQGYGIETAAAADTLQCRIFQAVKAAAGDEDACERASLSGSCVE